jgi:hypothetical protein
MDIPSRADSFGELAMAMARHGDNAFEIVRILVVGIAAETGIKPVRPAAYFSLFGIKEYSI